MRKGIIVVFIVFFVLAMVMAAAAKEDTGKKADTKNGGKQNDDKGGGKPDDDNGSNPNGRAFLEIWKAIADLQVQLKSGVTRAEFNELKARVDSLEGRIDLLEGRVAALEDGDNCHPAPETCNGIDDNCDGTADNGATCGEGQQCVNGQCISIPVSECAGIVDCMNTCSGNNNDIDIRCIMSCSEDASAEAQEDFNPLFTCNLLHCAGTGMPLFECLEQNCAEQLQSCIGSQPPVCTPSCAGRVCGSDGCDGSCGACSGNLVCSNAGQCITDPCNPNPCPTPSSQEPFCCEDCDGPAIAVNNSEEGVCSSSDDASGTFSCYYSRTILEYCEPFDVCENAKCIAGPTPCDSNPCTTPPDPECIHQGGIYVVITYDNVGECTPLSQTNYDCNYPYTITEECSSVQSCENGHCVGP